MKVILLKAVPKVGKAEEIVEVSEGFARNALFPKKLAIPATDNSVTALTKKQIGRAAEKAVQQTLLDKAIESLEGKSMLYKVPANEKGNLFSKIDAKAIAQYLAKEHRLSINPSCIMLPKEGIKHVGLYTIDIKDGSLSASLRIELQKK